MKYNFFSTLTPFLERFFHRFGSVFLAYPDSGKKVRSGSGKKTRIRKTACNYYTAFVIECCGSGSIRIQMNLLDMYRYLKKETIQHKNSKKKGTVSRDYSPLFCKNFSYPKWKHFAFLPGKCSRKMYRYQVPVLVPVPYRYLVKCLPEVNFCRKTVFACYRYQWAQIAD